MSLYTAFKTVGFVNAELLYFLRSWSKYQNSEIHFLNLSKLFLICLHKITSTIQIVKLSWLIQVFCMLILVIS
jgi:hypothetical protein